MKWEAIFFDFDGVIVDSVNIKTEAFAEMFRKYGPEIEAKVVAYHLANGGVSRYEKFRYWYQTLLNRSIDERQIKELSRQFSKLVLKKMIDAPFKEGALETLKVIKSQNLPAYIVTGTPNDEIQYIVKAKRLESYFNEIHGSPRKKDEIINDILQRKGYLPKNCLFIGDSTTDYAAALKTNVYFLGIVPKGVESPFPEGTPVSSVVTLDAFKMSK
jgi:HAD superfamily hydrolase (TIGR01549 family)